MALIGVAGSMMFALPTVIDKGLDSNGTLGLTLLDLFDHWAFSYGLLTCGLLECLILGWMFDIEELRAFINRDARIKLGRWFNHLVRFVLPAVILLIIGLSIRSEIADGLYGAEMQTGGLDWLHVIAFLG